MWSNFDEWNGGFSSSSLGPICLRESNTEIHIQMNSKKGLLKRSRVKDMNYKGDRWLFMSHLFLIYFPLKGT